ncbi:MAG: glutamate--cysteine ligase [Deltaproteobacteria bacterium]|jgi:gamma-glutamyl:cysteine ligase YbdK (ATP-grasp superfamily)|nr:glutamate--cysteine ligase [Deltaproteobacteria bacterium]
MSESVLHLFEGFGVELEYMIVDPVELSVRPIADALLHSVAGAYESEIENGDVAWSNELALHVFELKTNGPAPALVGLAEAFQRNVCEIDERLAPLGGSLLPGATHPWMDPASEFVRWPHEYGEIYAAFDRIFSCVGHGWSNLQSVHLNLPFAGDEEFGRLHAAIRVLLPILPALAASSPIMDGAPTGLMDTRLSVYRSNAQRVPSVSGQVIPEPVFDIRSYHSEILERIYRDLEPHDPEGILRHEWVNARGCIARFDRNAIEIRVLDTQECPAADMAVVAAATAVTRGLVDEALSSGAAQRGIQTANLVRILGETTRDADGARIDDPEYLALFGWRNGACSAGELWQSLIENCVARDAVAAPCIGPLETILAEGCLARRILRRLGGGFDRDRLHGVYRELADCLAVGEPFRVQPR